MSAVDRSTVVADRNQMRRMHWPMLCACSVPDYYVVQMIIIIFLQQLNQPILLRIYYITLSTNIYLSHLDTVGNALL